MKAVVIKQFCDSLDEIQVSDIPRPQPKPTEVLIKVVAAGVNFVDTLYARGRHQNNRSLVVPPFTLGLEFSGVILSAPANSVFKPGDAVLGDYGGSYSEFIVLPADSPALQRVPSGWSFTDAAGLGTTLPVSYGALALGGGLKAGETVLVHSAAGGLGIMAVQIAVAKGCRVLGTAGTAAKCAYAQRHGANRCFDYSQHNWWKHVLEVTDGRGVDVVFDPVGLVDLSLKCIAHRGRVLVVGFAGREGRMEKIAINRVLLKQVNLIGYRYGESLRRYPEEKKLLWDGIRPLVESGKVEATVFKTYEGLESVPEALSDLANRKVTGKAVIKVGSVERTVPKL